MLLELPLLDSDYPVDASTVQMYQEDGHIKLAGVCTPDEIRRYHRIIHEAAMGHSREKRAIEERDTYGKAFLQITNLWELDEQVKRFVYARRFGKIAAELMGVDAVRLYHDQALFKEAGGGHTPWHQDQYYWPLDTDKTITMWMALGPASPEMGTMRFASGSHKEGYLGAIAISDESEEYYERYLAEKGFDISPAGFYEPGDATFHSGWTLHSAPENKTQTMREAMTIIYYADGAKILEPDHSARMADMERWFPGQRPGDVAGTQLNPVVYSKWE
jgi:ectoine hydroxylase-related dioxygenase (phytanoyl-CoA dioxygenase family)